MRCPNCATDNPDGQKFCGECATLLAATEPALEREERKVVSVLFCDLAGFTAASDRQDPEDVRARMRPYHARLRRELERYGATVEKFIPLEQHGLHAARAHLAANTANHVQAAELYVLAASGWEEFGNVPERAYALLGQGRSLCTLGRGEAMQPLRQARDLFASMRYDPARRETESLLDQAAAISAG